jgi:hypothetical protein
MKIEHNKTYYFEIKNFSFGDIPREELIKNFKDGRCCSWFMEPQIAKWFPELSRVMRNKDHDHIDNDGVKYDAKNFTKGGLTFMPSNQMGAGRKFNESIAHKKASDLVYICCDIVNFPKIRVRFEKGSDLIKRFPKCRIKKSLREEFFNG